MNAIARRSILVGGLTLVGSAAVRRLGAAPTAVITVHKSPT